MLQRNNNVCITFSLGHKLVYQHKQVACSYSMRSESAMCRGKVEFIEDMEENVMHWTLSCAITQRISSAIPILPYGMSKYGKYL